MEWRELMENLANADEELFRTYENDDIMDDPFDDFGGRHDDDVDFEEEWVRERFIHMCLQLARNDATVLEMNDWSGDAISCGWKFRDSDLILLGNALVGNTHFQQMDTDLRCHPSVTPFSRGTKALRDGIAHSHLRELQFSNVYRPVQEMLFEGVALSPSVQHFEISETASVNTRALSKHLLTSSSQHESPSTNHIIMPIKPLPAHNNVCCVTHLCLKYCNLNDMDMLAFSLGFAGNRSLLSLSFEHNLITNVGVMYFCQHWTDDSPLQTLDLSWNMIGTKQATMPSTYSHLQQHPIRGSTTAKTLRDTRDNAWWALKRGLERHAALRSLNVSSNKMGAAGAILLLEAAASHPSLDTLDLSLDVSVGIEGLLKVALEIPSTKLKRLHLDWTSLPLHEPKPEMVQQVGQALVAAVQRNWYMTEFASFELNRQWRDPIDFFLDLNQTCRPLLTRNDWSASVWPYTLAHYGRNGKMSHAYFALREQPWLVCGQK
jgi:hypothetical protein